MWQKAGIEVPPVFIVVCSNTSASKLVYDFISGFERKKRRRLDKAGERAAGAFRNYDEHFLCSARC